MSGGQPCSIREMTRATVTGGEDGRERVYDEPDRDLSAASSNESCRKTVAERLLVEMTWVTA